MVGGGDRVVSDAHAPMNAGPPALFPAAIAFTLIETAKLNGVDPQAWLTWVLARIADQPHRRPAHMAEPFGRTLSMDPDVRQL